MLQKHCWVRWLCCNLKLVLVRFVSPRSWSSILSLGILLLCSEPGFYRFNLLVLSHFSVGFLGALLGSFGALSGFVALLDFFDALLGSDAFSCWVVWVLFLRHFVGFNVALLGSVILFGSFGALFGSSWFNVGLLGSVILFGSFGTLLGSVLSLYRQV